MADVEFDDFEGAYAASGGARVSRLVNLAGAACSVALIIGLGIWGYKLAVRDVTGIPVVRALEGPLRISPDNPGGEVTLHQGLSVNAVAASGTARPLPESLTLAPKGAELAAEDEAGLAVLAALPEAGSDITAETTLVNADLPILAEPVAVNEPIEIAVAAEVLPATQEEAVAAALAAALADGAEPFVPLDAAPELAALDLATPVALVKSLRPRPRPASPDASADLPEVAAAAPVEMDAASIAVGTRLVQLGAFDDEVGARGEWAKLQGRFAELITGKAMVVQAAQSGGRTFYRLRAHGFAGEDEARRFCAALLAENASCIPVSQR